MGVVDDSKEPSADAGEPSADQQKQRAGLLPWVTPRLNSIEFDAASAGPYGGGDGFSSVS